MITDQTKRQGDGQSLCVDSNILGFKDTARSAWVFYMQKMHPWIVVSCMLKLQWMVLPPVNALARMQWKMTCHQVGPVKTLKAWEQCWNECLPFGNQDAALAKKQQVTADCFCFLFKCAEFENASPLFPGLVWLRSGSFKYYVNHCLALQCGLDGNVNPIADVCMPRWCTAYWQTFKLSL